MILSDRSAAAMGALRILSASDRETHGSVSKRIGRSLRYAQEVCTALTRAKVTKSTLGRPNGGVKLQRDLATLRLREVVVAVDGSIHHCPIGPEHCTEAKPCRLYRHVLDALSLTVAEVFS